MKIIWKDIKGYKGSYQISSLGDVKSLPKIKGCYFRKKEIILKPKINRCGYVTIGLVKNNKAKWYMVHRLVANAFIKNNIKNLQINHKDGNKQNNNVDNLEWVTCSENHKHAFRTGLRSTAGEKHNNRKLNAKQAKEIFYSKKKGVDLAKKYNTCPSNICNIRKGKIWKSLNLK